MSKLRYSSWLWCVLVVVSASCVYPRQERSPESLPLRAKLRTDELVYHEGDAIHAWLDIENVSGEPVTYLDVSREQSLLVNYVWLSVTDVSSNKIQEIGYIVDPVPLTADDFAVLPPGGHVAISLGSLTDTNGSRYWHLGKGAVQITARLINDCSFLGKSCMVITSETVTIRIE